MKKYLVCALGLMVLALSVNAAWAYDENNHVNVAPNGRGDAVIYPVYIALPGDWSTKLTLINTDRSHSTVAKLVVRSHKYCQELLDFLIYLSPADVWTGTIQVENGKVYMHSTDDSCQSAVGVWASATAPLHRELASKCEADDSAMWGYVEIFESWVSAAGVMDASVPKATIKAAYEASTSFTTANILAGHYEICNPTMGVGTLDAATVLRDFDINTMLTVGTETSLADSVVNTICEVEAALSKDNLIMPYYNNGSTSSIHLFTFPTKKFKITVAGGVCTPIGVTGPFFVQNTEHPMSTALKKWAVKHDLKYWNLSEKSPAGTDPIFSPAPPAGIYSLYDEVAFYTSSLFDQSGTYKEGWVNYSFADELDSGDADAITETSCAPMVTASGTELGNVVNFAGVPVIPSTLYIGVNGVSEMTNAHDLGVVTYLNSGAVTPVAIPFYQYVDVVPAVP